MRLVVLGATGPTGRESVSQALMRGHEVTALVRRRARLASDDSHLTVVEGDVLEPGSLTGLFSGCDAVISALGARRTPLPVHTYSDGMRNVSHAMRAEAVERLVCLSAAGVGDTYSQLPAAFRLIVVPLFAARIYQDMERMERIVTASGLDWTIVRPIWLRSGPATHALRLAEDAVPSGRAGVSRADIAAFMLDVCESGEWSRARVGVAGEPRPQGGSRLLGTKP